MYMMGTLKDHDINDHDIDDHDINEHDINDHDINALVQIGEESFWTFLGRI